MKKPSKEEALEAVRTLLRWMGEDPERKNMIKTPDRFLKACEEYFSGYGRDPAHILSVSPRQDMETPYEDIILLSNIHFYSHCEHHLALVKGIVHIAYIPGENLVGLSKMAKLVDIYARRLQMQERMTHQIATAMMEHLEPKGVAVHIEAQHHCMLARGVSKEGSVTTTNAFTGVFKNDPQLRERFFAQVHHTRIKSC